ncbi:hypothetical protein RYX36_007199 [Vicia faba]
MVYILSRAMLFDEAVILIRSMPMKSGVYVLLAGCQMHGNTDKILLYKEFHGIFIAVFWMLGDGKATSFTSNA